MQPDSMYAKRYNNDENLNRILKKTQGPLLPCSALSRRGEVGGASFLYRFYADVFSFCDVTHQRSPVHPTTWGGNAIYNKVSADLRRRFAE